MTLAAVFRPEARPTYFKHVTGTSGSSPELGEIFSVALNEAVIRIEAMLLMYVMVFRGVRRGKLRTFPYLIYYRTLSDRIEVIAVLHGSRDPKLWQERVN
jgi:hypothetical protein